MSLALRDVPDGKPSKGNTKISMSSSHIDVVLARAHKPLLLSTVKATRLKQLRITRDDLGATRK